MDAEYYREWRASHPEYRARQREVRRDRRHKMTAEQRRKDRGMKKPEPKWSVGPLHDGHDLFTKAKSMASAYRGGFAVFAHPFYDDLVSELVLALLERRDARDARRAFVRSELAWLKNTTGLE